MAFYSKFLHASWISTLCSSSRCNGAQNRSQYVALKSTCKRVFGWHLLNTKSFLVSLITQQRAAAPVNNKRLCFCWPNLDQPPNIWAMFLGGLKPKTQWTIRHRALATIQSKNKCFMVSRLLQKLQTLLPFQFLLARLSLMMINFYLM